MSSSFIGSKIAIVTKSQSRYSGTIIGIDAQASSIVLGNVKCYGTENRLGNLSNGQLSGTLVPIMQFANSDIEDLKIVDEESGTETSSKQTTNNSLANVSAPAKQTSIHDDPAILSAVVSSSSNKESSSSMPNRLIHDLNQLNLSDENKKILPKTDESRFRTDSGDLTGSWSLLSPSKWNGGNSLTQTQPSSNNKSKFFDNFALNALESGPTHRPQRWASSLNTHATQTSNRSNQHDDERDLPTRQPFFADDQSYSPQQNFSSNGSYQHRNFSNQRRPPMRRRPMGGGNRETFYDNGVHYDDEFDFESSNRKFNKINSDDDFNQQTDSMHQFKAPIDNHRDPNVEFQPVYDKKKSFFDNISVQETADLPVPMYHRSRNQDTFGNNHHNDRYQRQKFRGNGNAPGGQRRSNYHNNGNNSNNNQNGYHYRY